MFYRTRRLPVHQQGSRPSLPATRTLLPHSRFLVNGVKPEQVPEVLGTAMLFAIQNRVVDR